MPQKLCLFFLGKSRKTAAIRAATPVFTKSFVGCRGFAPDPTAGTGAPPDPLAVCGGLLLKGGEGRERRGGDGRKGVCPLP